MLDFAGRRVTVMGLGRFGGGVGVTRWLAAQGADVLVTDLEPRERLAESVAAIERLVDAGVVRLRLGGHNVSDFTACDAVVANPAVPKPWENRFLRAAAAAGVPITTEIALVVRGLDRARVIGVTGSVGKSTTSAMIAHILRECGMAVRLGGNIGGSLLDEGDGGTGIRSVEGGNWVVLELSSAMLHWLRHWSPRVAVVTGIADNHLDWHGTFEHYVASKRVILGSQEPGDVAVLGRSVRDWTTRPGVGRVVVGDELAGVGLLRIPGRHNRVNAAMAVAAVDCLNLPGVTASEAWAAVAGFPGLPHRLQFVGEVGGVRFYNDSKSTTPEATLTAIRACDPGVDDRPGPGIVHLIAGGYDKGADLGPIAGQAPHLRALYAIGATGPRLAEAANRAHPPIGATCRETLEAALDAAFARAACGEVVLLSPGCASWDQFENYEMRGERFVELVRRLVAAQGAEA